MVEEAMDEEETLAKFSNSKTPAGPFHTITFALVEVAQVMEGKFQKWTK